MGLPIINIKVDVLHQVISGASRLVQMYRTSMTKAKDANIVNSQIHKELKIKEKKIDDLKDQINDLENDNKKQTNTLAKLHSEITTLKSQLHENDRDLQRARLYNKNKDAEWSHKITRMQMEINKLKGEPIENHLGHDEKMVRTIAQYKLKEEIYKDTIRQLQDNNEELQRQLLNIRDELCSNFNIDSKTDEG